jgi:hypothetical protein
LQQNHAPKDGRAVTVGITKNNRTDTLAWAKHDDSLDIGLNHRGFLFVPALWLLWALQLSSASCAS